MAIIFFVTLLASPAAADPTIPGGTFTDDDGNVHEGYIEAIATAGITRGCNPPSNYYYCPGDPVTRGQMAAFLVRALNLSHGTGDAFSDDGHSVFESDINALAAAGITRGCDPPANTRFCPNEPVTRGQMAAFLVRAFHFAAEGGSNHFQDDEGSVFEGDIDRLAASGITRGCDPPSNQRYCPDSRVLRDQMATFLARSLGLDATTPPPAGNRRVIASDTMIEHERLVLRPGESLEFRNGARLTIGEGASVDWQGTPTTTWSDDGRTQNLTRDVRIFGRGDIMFMRASESSTIRYVEVDLQPRNEKGHYPLHWHLVGDGSRGTLVEGVVVKNSTNRAFVPHGSHGITFRDTIAKTIKREAYWWDPGRGENDSHDILYDHALADGVTFERDDALAAYHRGSAFTLRGGIGLTVRDSVALNVSGGKNCSGFKWPEGAGAPATWSFENNHSVSPNCDGIFVWQNDKEAHAIDRFSGSAISHGAYMNIYDYRGVDVDGLEINALGWTMSDSYAGDAVARDHNQSAEGEEVVFTNVTFDSFTVDNAKGTAPGRYILDGSNLTCDDIVYRSVYPGTKVEIDRTVCLVP